MNKDVFYLSLGSNIGDCQKNLELACHEIEKVKDIQIYAKSKIWQTEPQNYKEQNWFYNQVIACTSINYNAEDILKIILAIEQKLGRVRTNIDYAPRVIDIDLLLFNHETIETKNLILPHPRMLNRAFVLVPLQEIATNLIINNFNLAFYLQKLQYKIEADKIYQS